MFSFLNLSETRPPLPPFTDRVRAEVEGRQLGGPFQDPDHRAVGRIPEEYQVLRTVANESRDRPGGRPSMTPTDVHDLGLDPVPQAARASAVARMQELASLPDADFPGWSAGARVEGYRLDQAHLMRRAQGRPCFGSYGTHFDDAVDPPVTPSGSGNGGRGGPGEGRGGGGDHGGRGGGDRGKGPGGCGGPGWPQKG